MNKILLIVLLCSFNQGLMAKKVLVTGGAGFLGSNLCTKLIEQGHSVIALDNLMTGRMSNLEQLIAHPQFTFVNHDITQPYDCVVDWIFNLACPASPPHYQKDPIHTMKTNVFGMLNLLELARTNKARILQTSTSEVYGNPLEHPQTEFYWGNVNPIGIRSCYDEGKRCAETLCFDYHRQYNVEIKVVRIFNTYGPNMDPLDGRVISNFIMQALQGKPITMYGDGLQTRSFCYVDDLVNGLIKMMESDSSVTGPINLGNPGEFNLLELANLVLQLTQSISPMIFEPLPQDDPVRRKPNIDLAKVTLGWEPTIALHDGLVKTIAYFKDLVTLSN